MIETVGFDCISTLVGALRTEIESHERTLGRAAGDFSEAKAAEEAGAPDGVIQVIDAPTLPLVEHVMKSDRIDLILATGGSPVVRAAYSSGNPALGVGPGNVPAYVDESADVARAARLAESKGSQTRAIIKVLGRGALLLAAGAFNLAWWVFAACLALLGFLASIKSTTERLTYSYLQRKKLKRARRELALAHAQNAVIAA